MRIAIDQNVNHKLLKAIKMSGHTIVQARGLEQQWGIILKQNKVFAIGCSRLDGPDVLGDSRVASVQNIIGRDSLVDVGHVCSAMINKCDYFVTNDADILGIKKKATLERITGLTIVSESELRGEFLD